MKLAAMKASVVLQRARRDARPIMETMEMRGSEARGMMISCLTAVLKRLARAEPMIK